MFITIMSFKTFIFLAFLSSLVNTGKKHFVSEFFSYDLFSYILNQSVMASETYSCIF